MDEILQCHYVQVNAAQIRTEMLNGREHLVLPSYTLPDNVVMNGGLYTRDQIEANYKQLEGTFAPLGHPIDADGNHISAATPEALHTNHVGAWNRNVERRGNRIYMEKWIDKEFAANTEKGRQLLEAVEKKQPIHTSVAAYVGKELTPNAKGYRWKAHIRKMDHDAILLGEPGAATPEQGVGLMVNVGQATVLQGNENALAADSYGSRSSALNLAARKRWGDVAWVIDFDSEKAIVRRDHQEPQAIGYTMEGDTAVFEDDGPTVKREESWVVNQINRICQSLGLRVNSETSEPLKPSPEAEQMDKEAIAALLKEQSETFQANLAEVIKPLAERLDTMEANQKKLTDDLQANAIAAEAPKRAAVAAVLGELAANALTGAALDEAYAKIQTAAPLLPGMTANANDKPKGAPKADEYFSKGA